MDNNINFESKRKGMYLNEYIAMFEYIIQEHCDGSYEDDNLIGAVNVVNSKLEEQIEANGGEISETFANIIIEASNYILNILLEDDEDLETLLRIFDGEFPLIVTVSETLKYEKNKKAIDKTISIFSETEKQLFDVLMEAIWDEEEDRLLSFDNDVLCIPKNINENEEELFYYSVKNFVVDFILGNCENPDECILFFTKRYPKKNTVAAIMNNKGFVSVITADELRSIMAYGGKKGRRNVPDDIEFEDFNIEF